MLVESAIIASNSEEPQATDLGQLDTSISLQGMTRTSTTLRDLSDIYPELDDTVKSTVYNWITSLPRAMQSSDESVKQHAVRNVQKGIQLVRGSRIKSSTLEDSLGTALKDSIVALVLGSKAAKVTSDDGLDEALSGSSALAIPERQLQDFRPVLMAQESQKRVRSDIRALIANFGSQSQQTILADQMLSYVRDSEGVDQISAYWLSFELLKAASSSAAEFESFVDFAALTDGKDETEAAFQELYSFSVSTLAARSAGDEADWRLEALALEVAAFAASRMRESFRPELIDVLYPVATFLGSEHGQLRSHAITTLNSIAAYCGYGSVSELIVNNADYMVNSVSLRLNTFDISPASTKVLRMMVALTGPRLIPYLDDVVAAIFAALDNYHGYPLFVEGLFSVLSEVVTPGRQV